VILSLQKLLQKNYGLENPKEKIFAKNFLAGSMQPGSTWRKEFLQNINERDPGFESGSGKQLY
jgi:hypothetical protein